MKYQIVDGLNCKKFVQVSEAESDEMWIYDEIEKVVTRSEYKPFIKSFNKTITKSYWFKQHFFPVQFLPDVKRALIPLLEMQGKEMNVEGEERLLFDVSRISFDDYIYNELKLPKKYDLNDEKYMYQPECAFEAIRNKIARIEVGTGGGKTMITYLYCRYMLRKVLPQLNTDARKILIVVPRKMLAKQLQDDFAEYDSEMPENDRISVQTIYSGAKKIDNAEVVVGTYQSLYEYEQEYYDDFFTLICDEMHTAKSYSIRNEIFNKMLKMQFAFGMTGTMPKYNTLDYLDVVSIFGDAVHIRKARQLIDSGVATPVKLHAIKINYEGKIEEFCKRLKEAGITGTEKLQEEKRLFQNMPERNEILRKLMAGFDGNTVILVDTVSYCELLKNFINEKFPERPCSVIHGKTSNDEREQIKKDIEKSDHYVLVATYGTMSTGVSINKIMNIFFVDGGKSEIRIKQSIGRGLRLHPEKEFLNVFDFQDNMKGSSFWNQALERNRIYRDEGHKILLSNTTIKK
mgnify:CR=1 FL=1